ncbi:MULTISPECIES: hypothetical protein [unclassified Methylobacterium]|jgi:hypothetical protein|nr:hypothetical protein [Methylobacterium sp. 2A]
MAYAIPSVGDLRRTSEASNDGIEALGQAAVWSARTGLRLI